ncbi:response regulator transcription factor [Paenibacillus sp. y28]|uniref:response regulator transcription factor n=1 Tax=Paenibacillus sp. y28 TaxID=3129110 RepID=UPI00301AFB4C
MFSALIIDDEEPARQAIRALALWDQLEVRSIHEAADGRAGLEQLQALKPDIVFVDMKMPYLSGGEFLEQARQVLPEAKYIVVSGFDEFEYAKHALRYGALDYLLKPIKRTELNQALGEAVRQLQEEAARREEQINSSILHNISAPLIKEKVFSSLIHSSGRFHQISELDKLYAIGSGQGQLRAAIIEVLNFDDVCGIRFAGDAHALYFALTNALNELCRTKNSQVFSFRSEKNGQELIAVMTLAEDWERTGPSLYALADRLETALHKLSLTFGTDAVAALTVSAYPLERLNEAYHAALHTLLHQNILPSARSRSVYIGPETVQAKPARGAILEKKELIARTAETGGAPTAAGLIAAYFDELERSGYFSLAQLTATTSELRLLLEHLLRHFHINETEQNSFLEQYDQLMHGRYMPFAAYRRKAVHCFETFLPRMLDAYKPTERIQPEAIKQYIDLHYYEDISLALFTEKYFVSREHLLRLFKQKFGYGIYEYTLKVRMDKAKDLLLDPVLSIQAVGESVGYPDSGYFRKAFKKHVGLSPVEYRQMRLREGRP